MIGILKHLGRSMRGSVAAITDKYVTLTFTAKEGSVEKVIGHARIERKYLDTPIIGTKFYLLEIADDSVKKKKR